MINFKINHLVSPGGNGCGWKVFIGLPWICIPVGAICGAGPENEPWGDGLRAFPTFCVDPKLTLTWLCPLLWAWCPWFWGICPCKWGWVCVCGWSCGYGCWADPYLHNGLCCACICWLKLLVICWGVKITCGGGKDCWEGKFWVKIPWAGRFCPCICKDCWDCWDCWFPCDWDIFWECCEAWFAYCVLF